MFICDINGHGMITHDIKYLYFMSLKRFFLNVTRSKMDYFSNSDSKVLPQTKVRKNVFALIIYFYVVKKNRQCI